MDAPYCKIEIVEVDVGFHMKQYAWWIFAGISFAGMYLFNYDLLKLMMTGELPW